MNKIRVLHVINELEPGGAEVLLNDLAGNYDRDRFEFYVTYFYGEGTLGKSISSAGVEVIDLSWNGRKHPLILFRLISLIRRLNVDIVHTHLVMASVIGRIAAKLAGVKAIVSTRHYETHDDINSMRFKLDRLTARMNDCLVAVSVRVNHKIKDEGLRPKRMEIIHNGTDTEFLKPLRLKAPEKRKRVVVGTIGNLSGNRKGYDTFLKTIADLARSHPGLNTEIIGEGSKIIEYVDFSAQLGISERVRFLGRLNRMAVKEKLAEWDIFMLCSNHEAFGIVVIEAMAMGLPVVVSNVGGLPEIVRDGIDGFLVNPKDVSGFAEKVDYLINNPDTAAEMGSNGRKRVVDVFSIKTMVDSYERLYRQLLQ
jgi:glycosyltransferase involved in cell wall biosynthesis